MYLYPKFSRPSIKSRVRCISPSNTYSISKFRISALLRAVIICPGDRKTKLCNRRAIVPISPGVTEDPVYTDVFSDVAVERAELLTLLLLALDILKPTEQIWSGITTIMDKSLGTHLHLWGFFPNYTCPTPPPQKQRWKRVSTFLKLSSVGINHPQGFGLWNKKKIS